MPPKKDTLTYQHVVVDILCLEDNFRIKKISYAVDLTATNMYRIYINGEFLLEDKEIGYTLNSIVDINELQIIKSYNNYISFTPLRKMTNKFINTDYEKNIIIRCHDKMDWVLKYATSREDYYAILHKVLTNIAFNYLLNDGRIAEFDD